MQYFRQCRIYHLKTRNKHYTMKSSLFAAALTITALAFSTSATAQQSATQRAIDRWQFGISTGITVTPFCCGEYGFYATAGRRFNRKHYLGAGLGCSFVAYGDDNEPENENDFVPFLPIYVDYTFYLPFYHFRAHSFVFGTELGTGFFPDKMPLKDWDDRWRCFARCKFGLDFTIYKRLGLQINAIIQQTEVTSIGLGAAIRL